MTRYLFYIMSVSMLIHTVIFVPRVHIDERYHGAIASFLIGPLIGFAMTAVFIGALRKFQGQGVPEVAAAMAPRIVYMPILFVTGLLSLATGALVWIHCTFVFAKYLNPGMAPSTLLILFVTVTCLVAMQTSKTVLYGTEIIFVLSMPLLLLVLLHGAFNKSLNVDSIRVMLDYALIMPSWNSLSASTNTFAGYIGFSIFNRVFANGRKVRCLWIIAILGFVLELASFFIPIGFHGTDGVDDYIYTWVSTVDAINIKYIMIERVISVYLLISLVVTFVFTMIAWHIGAQTIGGCFRSFNARRNGSFAKWCGFGICAAAGVATVVAGIRIDEDALFTWISWCMQIGLPIHILFVLFVFWLGTRLRIRREGT